MMKRCFLLAAILFLSGCTHAWTPVAPDGTRLEDAEPICRAQARESAWRQIPDPWDWYDDGRFGGFPPDTRRDIEERETAWCLKQKGFRLMRKAP